jgi:uncharacterized protein (TIGR02246 family)
MYRPYVTGARGSFSDTESAIRGFSQDFCTAFNTGNYDHVAALFAAEALFMPPHREPAQGSKMIERVLREFGEMGYHELRFETTRVDHANDFAVEIGNYAVTIQQGKISRADRGKYLRSWRRLGMWLITAECWNSNLPLSSEGRAGVDAKVA